jgi:hypothetical protein
MFIGATNIVSMIPEAIGGSSATTLQSSSPLLSATIVTASLRIWKHRVKSIVDDKNSNQFLKDAAIQVATELNKYTYNNNNGMLRLT